MSKKYPGGFITKNTPTTTGGMSGAAPGVWTLDQQMQAQKAGAWPVQPVWYVEDVFSTFLYTGTGSAQTFNNGVDLSTKGGMVWIKQRSSPAEDWRCVDSARGINFGLQQNLTNAQQNWTGLGYVTSFNTNGFSIDTNVSINTSAYNYASWSFRKQPKFFDVVTWTGNASTNRTIAHSLGSVPGCIIVKRTDAATNWIVYHRGLTSASYFVKFNLSDAQAFVTTVWNQTAPTDTSFTIGNDATVNASGGTYVAYLFAHNAGGFGPTGTDNVISCGSFTTNGSGVGTFNLGFEPQWLLVKAISTTDNWIILDSMRGLPNNGTGTGVRTLLTNASDAEVSGSYICDISATGVANFIGVGVNTTCIYIAIRRPMKTPTSGASVFAPVASGNNVTVSGTLGFTTNIVTDLLIRKGKGSGTNGFTTDRLRGGTAFVSTNLTNAEAATLWNFASQTGVILDSTGNQSDLCGWAFRRAPGFFDVVCYTGTGVAGQTYSHNLGVKPQLMLVKGRSGATEWTVYSEPTAATKYLVLNQIGSAQTSSTRWNDTEPTASLFALGTSSNVNGSGSTYVAYLFASCPGVSKVGSYTGTGASRTIDCGFAGGARFVLIKRTDSTSGWYVWDTSRGMSSSTDPYLFFNTLDPQVTTTNWIDTASTGFSFTGAADDEVNLLNASYIYLAIA